jgi:hypothetical protein
MLGFARFVFSLRRYQLYSVLVPILSGITAWIIGALIGNALKPQLGRRVGVALSSIAFVTSILVIFAHYRCSEAVLFDDIAWPRPWPYPDEALADLNNWFDKQNPASNGELKVHGEFAKAYGSLVFQGGSGNLRTTFSYKSSGRSQSSRSRFCTSVKGDNSA